MEITALSLTMRLWFLILLLEFVNVEVWYWYSLNHVLHCFNALFYSVSHSSLCNKCIIVIEFIGKMACKIGENCTNISKKHAKSLQPKLHMKNIKRRKKLRRIMQKNKPNKDTTLEPIRPTHGKGLIEWKFSKTLNAPTSTERIKAMTSKKS